MDAKAAQASMALLVILTQEGSSRPVRRLETPNAGSPQYGALYCKAGFFAVAQNDSFVASDVAGRSYESRNG